jgi:Na+-translocating ferredoxin:NAD+ oxidoreductase RnfA subunit
MANIIIPQGGTAVTVLLHFFAPLQHKTCVCATSAAVLLVAHLHSRTVSSSVIGVTAALPYPLVLLLCMLHPCVYDVLVVVHCCAAVPSVCMDGGRALQ